MTKTPATSLSALDSVFDKLNDLSVCVERLNATVSNLSRSHPAPLNTFSPQHFSTPKRDDEFFRGPRNFCNSSQTNFQGPAAHATYSKTPNQNQTSKDVSLRSENELTSPTRICVSITHVSALAPVLAGNRATGVAHGEVCFATLGTSQLV